MCTKEEKLYKGYTHYNFAGRYFINCNKRITDHLVLVEFFYCEYKLL